MEIFKAVSPKWLKEKAAATICQFSHSTGKAASSVQNEMA